MPLAADGLSNREIGETIDMPYKQVGIWRKHYTELGLASPLEDEERSCRPHIYDHDSVLSLVKLVTENSLEGGLVQPISAMRAW